MAGNIDIDPDMVAGLVPVLRNPGTFEAMHALTEGGNAFFRFAHEALVTAFSKQESDPRVIDAFSAGIGSYELLASNTGTIPQDRRLRVVRNYFDNPDYSANLSAAMERSARVLVHRHPELAQGVLDLSEARVLGSSPELLARSIYGAAIMRAAHVEASNVL